MVGVVVTVACVGVLAASLGVAAATDLRCRIIPNGCSAAAALSGLVRAVVVALCGGGVLPLARALAGGTVVLAVMLAASALSSRLGRGPGVGGGDVKLLSAVGVWAGPVGGLLAVGLSCLVGVIGWLVVAPRERGRPPAIPLGPAIAAASLAVVLATPPVASTL